MTKTSNISMAEQTHNKIMLLCLYVGLFAFTPILSCILLFFGRKSMFNLQASFQRVYLTQAIISLTLTGSMNSLLLRAPKGLRIWIRKAHGDAHCWFIGSLLQRFCQASLWLKCVREILILRGFGKRNAEREEIP